MLATDYNNSKREHIPRIIIEVIDHKEQRYETPGDYFYNDAGDLIIKVSRTSTKYEALVAIHELVEVLLCDFKGVKEEDITAFDIKFEKMRSDYPEFIRNAEPGDDETAPYHHEHQMASRVEHWIADSCGVDWDDYDNTINKLRQ